MFSSVGSPESAEIFCIVFILLSAARYGNDEHDMNTNYMNGQA